MLSLGGAVQRSFSDLTDREVLALAIQSEEEDGRVYRELAEGLRATYPTSAAIFDGMAEEENEHRRRLLDLFRERFGDVIPLIRREDVRGFIRRKPVWMSNGFDIDTVRQRAETMEAETQRFYLEAASRTQDPSVRKLLGDLAAVEAGHEALASRLQSEVPGEARTEEKETARRLFVLQVIQPGLAGLMDGSVSTLAPVFAAASRPATAGTPSWSAWPRRSGPGSRWASRKRFRTTAASRGGGVPGSAASSAV